MKARYLLLALAGMLSQAYAGAPCIVAPALDGKMPCKNEPKLCAKRLSGSLSAGYATNYTCRGLVASHSLVQGDSAEKFDLSLSYDIGRKGFFTIENNTGYTVLSSGHKLFGAPANFENELTTATSVKYTRKYLNASIGHQYTHGGLLGAIAKHAHGQAASSVNELFVTIAATPLKCLEIGVKTSYAFEGLHGWWFEPYIKNTFTLVGTCDAPKLQSVLTLGLTATSNFFNSYDTNDNGVQAIWIEAALPWHITKSLVLTPGVSFNWLGCGAVNNGGAYRNQGIVGSVSVSYSF